MQFSRTLPAGLLAAIGLVLAVPPARHLLAAPGGVWSFTLGVLGLVVALALVAAAGVFVRDGVEPDAALRVVGWTCAGLVLMLVVLALGARTAAVTVPRVFGAVLLSVTAFAHVVIGVTDVRRIRAEELATERRRSAVFTRVLRHNLRTEAQLLAGQAEGEPDADAIRDRADSLAALSDAAATIDRALDRDEGAGSAVDVADVVADVVAEARETHPDAEVRTAGPETCTAAAGRQFRVAVRELLENSLQHGTGAITVSVACEDPVRVRVSDEGGGVPAAERRPLAGSGPETPLEHSSGLGLWTAKWIAQSYGGDLGFDGGAPVLSVPAA